MPVCLQFSVGFGVDENIDLDPYANDVVKQQYVELEGHNPNGVCRVMRYVVTRHPFRRWFLPWLVGVFYWHYPAEEENAKPNFEFSYVKDKNNVNVIQLRAPFIFKWILCPIAYILWMITDLWWMSREIIIAVSLAILACLLPRLANKYLLSSTTQ